MNAIHVQETAEGMLSVYENGDYSVGTSDVARQLSSAQYYHAGTGPPTLVLLVERVLAMHAVAAELAQQRATPHAPVVSPADAVRGRSQEDRWAVPEHMRSSVARFRTSERLRSQGEEAEAEERLRQVRARAAWELGHELGSLHAALYELIAGHGAGARHRRYTRVLFSDSTRMVGGPSQRRTEIEIAVQAGLIVEAPDGALSIADMNRGAGNDITDLLRGMLPGFGEAYDAAFETTRRAITRGYLDTAVLACIDILELLVPLGLSRLIPVLSRFRQIRSAIPGASSARPPATPVRGRSALPDRATSPAARGVATPQTTPPQPPVRDRGGPGEPGGSRRPVADDMASPRRRPEPRFAGTYRGNRVLSPGETRNAEALARRYRQVTPLPEVLEQTRALRRTRPPHGRGSEGQRARPGVEGASFSRQEVQEFDRQVRAARVRDGLDDDTNPDLLCDDEIWDSKVLAEGLERWGARYPELATFNPRSLYDNVMASVGRRQARRIAINADNVAGTGPELVQAFREARPHLDVPPSDGLFPRGVREVVIVRDGQVYPLYSSSDRWRPPEGPGAGTRGLPGLETQAPRRTRGR